MAEDLVDPELELEDDEVSSEGARWARQAYTARFTKVQVMQALADLSTLINTAMQSSDPKVAYHAGRYVQTKAVCDYVAQAAHGDDHRFELNLKIARVRRPE